MKKILFILPALALAAGCAEKMETPAEEPQGRLLEISASYCDFSDTDAPASKAVENGAETEFTDGDAIGVFAVGADGAVMEDCKNVKCVYDEASKTWSGKVYEYADAEYFAYYPYSEEMTDAGSAEDVIAAFTTALSSVSDQSTHALYTACDLMIAQNAEPNIENSMLTLRFSHAMSMIEITLPRIEYRTSAGADPYYSIPSLSSSLTIGGAEVSPFVVEPGVQFPELYLQACNLDTGGERTEVEADLHKVYCKVTLYLNTEGAYPYDLMVSGGVTGYDLSGRMVYGTFEYSPEPDNGGVCSVCVPRQADSTLRLAIREADNTLREFAIGEYILASGYDWSAEDLEDIDIEIDYAKTDVSFTVNGWETTVSLEVII